MERLPGGWGVGPPDPFGSYRLVFLGARSDQRCDLASQSDGSRLGPLCTLGEFHPYFLALG